MKIYCWHCGYGFEKRENKDGTVEFFELCPKCGKGFAELSKESQIAVLNTLKPYNNEVFWIQAHEYVDWKPKRTPALGWSELTLLEALCDSAKTLSALGNYAQAQKSLNKMLQILRNRIAKSKRDQHDLIKRCEFRENARTRCNRTPVQLIENHYYCKQHVKVEKC